MVEDADPEIDRRVRGERNVEGAAGIELAHDLDRPMAIGPPSSGSQVGTVALPRVSVQDNTRDHGADRNASVDHRIVAHDFRFKHDPGGRAGDAGGLTLNIES